MGADERGASSEAVGAQRPSLQQRTLLRPSGAAGFEIMPTYNDSAHMMDRCLFMNNYGVRTMPPESPFHTWNWNAPIWLGVNTISVNGKTTTLVGSSMWGLEIMERVRDNIEITLRDIDFIFRKQTCSYKHVTILIKTFNLTS